jgi:hypothetical protein
MILGTALDELERQNKKGTAFGNFYVLVEEWGIATIIELLFKMMYQIMSSKHLKYSVDTDGIACVTWDVKPSPGKHHGWK